MPVSKSKRRVWTHPKIKGNFRGTTKTLDVSSVRKSGARVEVTFILVPMDEKKKGDAYQKKCHSFESWQEAVSKGWVRK